MSTFVESLKRLYVSGRIAVAKMDELLAAGKVTQEEYTYVISG